MPRDPTYDSLQATPSATPMSHFDAPTLPDVAGRQAQQIGQGMMQAGEAVGRIATDMQYEANVLRRIDARNQAREAMFDLMYPPGVGRIDDAVEEIKAAAGQKAHLLGLPQTLAYVQARKDISNAHQIAIDNALKNGKTSYAALYFKKYKGQRDADDLLRVEGLLGQAVDGQAVAAADSPTPKSPSTSTRCLRTIRPSRACSRMRKGPCSPCALATCPAITRSRSSMPSNAKASPIRPTRKSSTPTGTSRWYASD